MKKNILIVHYNTPRLTECLVRSINLFVKDAIIYIFDNSTDKPFTAEFDNVTIIDNTKGQIINFDKWLEKYPNSKRSPGKANNWGSAKHCYSVEKCMDIIKEPFILLDSDVLLKKDISELFDEKVIYCGEVIIQPNSTIKRVLPFVCYINTPRCKELNVHYFDDNHMHGLYKSGNADRYDTGAGFFLSANKQTNRLIKCDNYVIHYGHGSWNKAGYKQTYTIEEWLKKNKRCWSTERNKNVVYTCIVGEYDTLSDPKFVSDGFDYVCFTDSNNINSDIWDVRPLPNETNELPKIKKQRYVKINPHKVLGEYQLSIWVDGNVELKGDLNKFVKETIVNECSIYVPKHPFRNCIYDEESAVLKMRKDSAEITNPQIKRYKEEGFPKNYGLLQSNILLRKHNDKDCIKLMEDWFDELKDNSHRDQLSFNYVCWKNQDIKVTYMDKNIYKSEYFHWNGKHIKIKVVDNNNNNNNNEVAKVVNSSNTKQDAVQIALNKVSEINKLSKNKNIGRIAYMNKKSTFNIGIY